jgi:hypothetical protein
MCPHALRWVTSSGRGQRKGVQMYIGLGTLLLVLLIVLLIVFVF